MVCFPAAALYFARLIAGLAKTNHPAAKRRRAEFLAAAVLKEHFGAMDKRIVATAKLAGKLSACWTL